MKQRLHKMLSILLSVALIASACVGALSASVLPAKASDPVIGYFDDLMEQARNYCPAASLSQFDNVVQQIHDNFDSWLVVVIYRPTDNSWYVASYVQDTSKQLNFWGWRNTYYYYFYPTYLNDPSYTHSFWSRYGFKIVNGRIWFEPYNSALGNQTFDNDAFWNSGGWSWSAPTPDDINESSRSCYTNIDLHAYNGTSEPVFLYANLVNGSYVPPVIDFHWFKFQLGQRWYITTYDQSLVNMMVEIEDSFWAMTIDVRDDLGILTDHFTIWPDMMQRLPGAENFISQNLTNVSASGVYAYDITDLVLEDDVYYYQLDNLKFYSYSGTQFDWLTQLVAQSEDVVDLVLTPDQENDSQNNAWTEINNYFVNYPTVSIVPEQLASQVAGDHAVSAGFGKVQIPEQLVIWMQHGTTLRELDSDFHYGFTDSGLDPDDSTLRSMFNYDILNVCVIASRGAADPNISGSTVNRIHMCEWLYTYENDPSDDYTVDVNYFANFDHDDIWQSYDLVFIVDADEGWLMDPHDEYDFSHLSSLFYRVGYTGPDLKRGNFSEHTTNGQYPAYWVLTRSAILKSQLFVFCDSQNKLYKLLSDYVEKRDLWDSSFLNWSMSVFWELETINGHLMSIQNEVLSWHLAEKFNSLLSKADQIIQNTAPVDEENVDPWYLSLWNFILQFKPSNSQISTGIDYIDHNLDDIPLLPYLTPVPALPTPGGG